MSDSDINYTLDDLCYLMARLRDPEYGCPWDLKQDFASIIPHTLEEAYEVADTIEREATCLLQQKLRFVLRPIDGWGEGGLA